MTGPGHNSGIAVDQLRSIIERVERLDEEIKALNADKRDIYAEAKGFGFDVLAIKQIVRMRAQDASVRQEREAILELYLHALGMLPGDAIERQQEPARPSRVHVREEAPPAHDRETGEIHDPATPAAAPEPAAAEAERREAEAGEAVVAEASAESSDGGPEPAVSASPNSGSLPVVRQVAALGEGGAVIGGARPAPRPPITFPLDAQGHEDPGDIPDYLRRA